MVIEQYDVVAFARKDLGNVHSRCTLMHLGNAGIGLLSAQRSSQVDERRQFRKLALGLRLQASQWTVTPHIGKKRRSAWGLRGRNGLRKLVGSDMHGFKDAASFAFLQGLTVELICLGQYQTQIHFHPQGRISMEGQYVHAIPSDNRQIVQPRSSCGPNDLSRLLGQSVTDAVVISDNSLRLTFSNGDTLTLVVDTDQYESFVIAFNQLEMVI